MRRSPDEPDQPRQTASGIAEYLAHWKRVGPLLEARRREELARMTDAERRRAIQSVLGLVKFPRPDRMTSGLVEYYRKLKKLYDQ